MMKKIFTLFGLLLSMTWISMNAEVYTGKTSPVPDGATYGPSTNPNAAPGVYSELSGMYDLDLRSVYYMISNYSDYLQSKVLVVDDRNEIVAEYDINMSAAGARYFNVFSVNITEPVTTPGTYYIVYPTSSGWDVSNDAYITPNEKEPIYNMKAGPYVIGEIKDAIDANFTLAPQGDIEVGELPDAVTLTVEDADMFNVGDLETVITVTNKTSGETLVMEPGVKTGNTISWEFPIDGVTGKPATLSKGSYDITVDFSSFKAYTADLNPLVFPAEPQTYSFNVGGILKVAPNFSFTPAPGKYDQWDSTKDYLGLKLLDGYKFKTKPAQKDLVLRIVKPDGSYDDMPLNNTRYTETQVQWRYVKDYFAENGLYTCIILLDGMAGLNPDGEDVIFKNISAQYQIGPDEPKPVNAELAIAPEGEFEAEGLPEAVTLSVSNAISLAIAEDAQPLTVKNASDEIVVMQSPVIDGSTISWDFPADWDKPAGDYTVSIDFSGISGVAAEDAKLIFPETPASVSFSIKAVAPPLEHVDLSILSVSPDPESTSKWEASEISVEWNSSALKKGWKLTSEGRDKLRDELPIVITRPDGTEVEILSKSKINFLMVKFAVPVNTFNMIGRYTVTVPTAGLPLQDYTDKEKLAVCANDLTVTYDITSVVTGVDTIDADAAAARYFDLNGHPMSENPLPGIYVRIAADGTVSKVAVK